MGTTFFLKKRSNKEINLLNERIMRPFGQQQLGDPQRCPIQVVVSPTPGSLKYQNNTMIRYIFGFHFAIGGKLLFVGLPQSHSLIYDRAITSPKEGKFVPFSRDNFQLFSYMNIL